MATQHSGPSETLNHQQQVIEILSNLYNKAEFSDVEIVVNGSLRVNAHKLLLISQSTVFSTMLSSERWADSKQKTINLVEDDQCLPHFEDFLKYFYTGSITIDTRNAFPVHCLADKYHVSNLKQSCEQFMLKNVAAPGEFNRAISWRKYSKLANLKKLEEDCDKFIAWNMNTIIQSPDWSTIDREHLLALLQRSDLVVESELSLLEAVVNWLGHQPTRIEEVLQYIRYPLIPPEEFFKFQASGTMDQAVCSFILAKGIIAYQANSVSVETLKQSHDITSPAFSMRLYTSKDYGSPLEIQNYMYMEKIQHQMSFTSKMFQAQSTWSITFYPKGERITVKTQIPNQHANYRHFGYQVQNYQHEMEYQEQVVKDDNNTAFQCTVDNCTPSQSNHEHRLTVLLMKPNNDGWFVSDIRSINVLHSVEARIHDLIPESEREDYVRNNTMKLHLIGSTVWK